MKLNDFIYVPRLGGFRFTEYQCACAIEAITDSNGRYIKYHQCENRPKHKIGEFSFCGQHYKLITKRFEELEKKNLKDLGF